MRNFLQFPNKEIDNEKNVSYNLIFKEQNKETQKKKSKFNLFEDNCWKMSIAYDNAIIFYEER